MEERKTIFDYIGQIFVIFGFSMIFLMILCYSFGTSAKGYSSIFELGAQGLTVSTMAQFLLTSTIIVLFRFIFFTDVLIKNLSITGRTIGMFISVIVMIVLFVWWFEWFPVNDLKPWIMFFVCFIVSTAGGVGISAIKEKMENKKMQEALERMKEREE